MTIEQTARDFFEACAGSCQDDAGFACQADALAKTTTLTGYAEWMKGLLGPIPDGLYELTGFAADEGRVTVLISGVFHGAQTGAGRPGAATGKTVASDYAYVMSFKGGKISHMTKIWNDAQALRQLGWA